MVMSQTSLEGFAGAAGSAGTASVGHFDLVFRGFCRVFAQGGPKSNVSGTDRNLQGFVSGVRALGTSWAVTTLLHVSEIGGIGRTVPARVPDRQLVCLSTRLKGGKRAVNLFTGCRDQTLRTPSREDAMNNSSMFTADRMTHLKIVVVSLVCATLVAGIGIAARVTDGTMTTGRLQATVIKAAVPVTAAATDGQYGPLIRTNSVCNPGRSGRSRAFGVGLFHVGNGGKRRPAAIRRTAASFGRACCVPVAAAAGCQVEHASLARSCAGRRSGKNRQALIRPGQRDRDQGHRQGGRHPAAAALADRPSTTVRRPARDHRRRRHKAARHADPGHACAARPPATAPLAPLASPRSAPSSRAPARP